MPWNVFINGKGQVYNSILLHWLQNKREKSEVRQTVFPHWTVLKRLGFQGQNLSLYAIIAQRTVHGKGNMIVLAKDILKLVKIALKVGKKIKICVVILTNFEKVTEITDTPIPIPQEGSMGYIDAPRKEIEPVGAW